MIVSCPKCGQQLKGDPGSIGTCPKCQTRLQFPEGDSNQGEPITCPHCGQVQRYKDGKCISCGKMLSESGRTPKNGKDREKKKNKTKVIVLSVILFLIVGACVWGYKLVQKKEYIDTLYDFQYNVIFGASTAEDLGNLTRSVWYDAIFEEYDPETWEYVKNEYDDYVSDFNVALQNLSNDSDIKDKKDLITSFQKDVTQNIKDLADPPSGLEDCYSICMDLYQEFNNLCDMAVSPTGSLESYTNDFRETDGDLADLYERLSIIMPEKIELPWDKK